ncbi:SufD family Fe-S cluster assembly protein [Alicyclobacillaceae bacterium I2511]|nr:SufD family Fe-S cluster assembly protein [Alicyclobacillaceae bacterium I2511]
MTTMEQTVATSPLVTDISARFHEPEWLLQQRLEAWQTYTEAKVPRLEKTDLSRRSWDIDPLKGEVQSSSGLSESVLSQLQQQPRVHIQDGQVVSTFLPDTLVQAGVLLCDLQRAVVEHGDLVQRYLGSVVTAKESKWTALNAAVWINGVFLYIPDGVQVEPTIHYIYEFTDGAAGGAPHSLVVAGEGSRGSIVEVLVAGDSLQTDKIHTDVLEVVAHPEAHLTVSCLTQYRKGPTYFTVRRARVYKNATVDWVFGDVGDGFTVGLLESVLQGDGSKSTLHGFGLGFGRQHFDLTASMLHQGRHSESDMVLQGVLRGRAYSVYRTSTHIFKGAIGAGSEQTDRMVMLDPHARADAIPMLLIDENDVQRCGHAASVGQLDEEQVYYLESRGISRREAMRMIVWGHVAPMVLAIPSALVQELANELIDRELA